MQTQPIVDKEYCNVRAIQHGLDPAGHAGHFDDAIVLETPLPWKREIYQTAGALPQEMIDLLALWLERYRAGAPYNHRPLMIAPDPEYSRKGYRRVMFFKRQAGAFAHYAKTEYWAPEEELGALIWALYEAQDRLPAFEDYRTPTSDPVRDILVCTHGTIDVACAKFGYPLYRHLRDAYADDNLRVWRVSHFGGHVFAPTLMDMPTGHYWAYVENDQAAQIIGRSGNVATLRGYYRGWSGLDYGPLQVAEREMWQREGWRWFDYAKCGEVVAQDSDEKEPQWTQVRVTYAMPDGTEGVYTARVEVTHSVETKYSTDRADTHVYPQYGVTELEKHSERYPWQSTARAVNPALALTVG